MHNLVYCLTQQHDWRFVVGAVVLCVAGSAAGIALLDIARVARGGRRRAFAGGAALVGAVTVWSTHFLAMLGYHTGPQPHYDVLITLASFGIAAIGLMSCVILVLTGAGRLRRVVGSLAAASAVSVMHFVGLSALVVAGARLTLDPLGASLAVGGSLVLAGLAGLVSGAASSWRFVAATLLAAGSVAVLHFVAMDAVTLVSDFSAATPAYDMTGGVMFTVTMLGVACVASVTAGIAALTYWSRSSALRQLRDAIDSMPSGLAFYDDQDRLVAWNRRYEEVKPELRPFLAKGATFTELLRRGAADPIYVAARGREAAWVADRLAARHSAADALQQELSDGRWRRVQDRRTAAGGTVTVVEDITEQKRQAQVLAEARDAAESANRAKSAFLANMSHEIRTPLNGVLGLAQALARTELTPQQAEILALIHSSGETLQALLSDILDLARVEAGHLDLVEEPFDLARAVSDAARLYAATAEDKGLSFEVSVAPEAEITVVGDMVRLKQILTNLISNALKFTAEGRVSLTVAVERDRAGRELAVFHVTDTGVGFDAAARERLFSRFEQADGTITRRFGGSGLGLAISQQLATLLGGELDCESVPGRGSTFTLTLPVVRAAAAPATALTDAADPAPASAAPRLNTADADADAAPEADASETAASDAAARAHTPARLAQAAASRPEADAPQLRVLLADDHATNRRVVELILAPLGVSVTAVEDGRQAVDAFRLARFDLVLMDMQMPVMDGLSATREIRRLEAETRAPRTPVVMLTANVLPEQVAAGEAAGADAHMAKPIHLPDLLHLVTTLPTPHLPLAA